MSRITDPRFEGIDFERSFLTGVIYDDESLSLEMDFLLTEGHPRYVAPEPGSEGCYRGGYIRFGDIDDLQIDKAKPVEGKSEDYSIIYSASGEGQRFEFSTGWGEIKVAAGAVRVALD